MLENNGMSREGAHIQSIERSFQRDVARFVGRIRAHIVIAWNRVEGKCAFGPSCRFLLLRYN